MNQKVLLQSKKIKRHQKKKSLMNADSLFSSIALLILVASTLVGAGRFILQRKNYYFPLSLDDTTVEQRDEQMSKLMNLATTFALRIITLPLPCILCAWSLAKNPETLTRRAPALFRNYSNAAVSKLIPIYARNRREAFELGQIYLDHKKAESEKNDRDIAACLESTIFPKFLMISMKRKVLSNV